nr:hypothetical protein Iba_chr09dCG0530 [Ipomoea batatas]
MVCFTNKYITLQFKCIEYCNCLMKSQENVSALLCCIIWASNCVPHSSLRFKNLIVISTLVCFVSEKMDFIELIKVSQAICLVPSSRENLKANLAPDGKSEVEVSKFFSKD